MFIAISVTGSNYSSSEVSKAYQDAVTNNKYMFIYFHSNGCTYCTKMERETFENDAIIPSYGYSSKKLKDNLVSISYNVSNPNDAKTFALYKNALANNRTYNKLTGFPCFVLINPHGKKLMVGSHTGFLTSKEFADWVNQCHKDSNRYYGVTQ